MQIAQFLRDSKKKTQDGIVEKGKEDMAYCVKCGAKVDDGTMSCPQCGAPIPDLGGSYSGGQTGGSKAEYSQAGRAEYSYGQWNGSGPANSAESGYDSQVYFDESDVRRNKAMGVLSYIGILVLIPLIAGDKQSQYVKHHVNQGLVLYILFKVVDLLEGDWWWGFRSFFRFGGGVFSWIVDIIDLALFILLIMGIVTACRGERRELPLIGKIKFFK